MVRERWAKARLLFHTVRDLGLPTIAQIVSNTTERRREQQAEAARRARPEPELPPGDLQSTEPTQRGVRLVFAGAALEVEFLAADVVRLTWDPGVPPAPDALSGAPPWPAPEVTVDSGPEGVSVSVAALSVRVAEDGSVTAMIGGVERRRWSPPLRRGESWQSRFRPLDGERFFGLGEQAAGADLRGGRFRLWNRDPGGSWGPGASPLYLNVPVLVAPHPAGCVLSFYENHWDGRVTLPAAGEVGEVSVWFAGGQMREYLVVGDPATVLDRYSALTGRPAVPPRWALGYHQSRWGYKREADVREVLDGYRALGVPLSAVHLDIDYMDGYRVFTVDRSRFPDLPGLTADATAGGTRLVTIVDPGVKVDGSYELYREGRDEGHFCTGPDGEIVEGVVWPGRAAFPDFTSGRTRSWWGAQYEALTAAGIGGIWHDMNEPTSIALAGDPTLPLSTRHDLDGRGGDHRQAHNLYGMLMNRAAHEALRALEPGRRPWIVSRSGWAGVQRWAWNWTGDVETSWEGLRQQVATLVGMGLSGVAFAGPDIGGFSGVPDAELYLRWLQMSVWLPFCRTHSVVGAPPREPWRFDEPWRSRIVAAIFLRYRLLPYLYTLALQAADTGAPLVRPLWWGAPGLAAGPLGSADDAFLLGDDVVVAPVTSRGAASRSLLLPPGRWTSLWGEPHWVDGGETVTKVPDGAVPVLVRAGAIVALDDGWSSPHCALQGDEVVAAPVRLDRGHRPVVPALHCWPHNGTAAGTVVDDEGDGDGPRRTDRLELVDAEPGGLSVLRWTAAGAYRKPPLVRVVLHGLEPLEAEADGAPVTVAGRAVLAPAFDELTIRMR